MIAPLENWRVFQIVNNQQRKLKSLTTSYNKNLIVKNHSEKK